jgi:serine/threonine protein kinase
LLNIGNFKKYINKKGQSKVESLSGEYINIKPPEILKGQKTDIKTDIYQVGQILYYMIYRKRIILGNNKEEFLLLAEDNNNIIFEKIQNLNLMNLL